MEGGGGFDRGRQKDRQAATDRAILLGRLVQCRFIERERHREKVLVLGFERAVNHSVTSGRSRSMERERETETDRERRRDKETEGGGTVRGRGR